MRSLGLLAFLVVAVFIFCCYFILTRSQRTLLPILLPPSFFQRPSARFPFSHLHLNQLSQLNHLNLDRIRLHFHRFPHPFSFPSQTATFFLSLYLSSRASAAFHTHPPPHPSTHPHGHDSPVYALPLLK